MFAIWSPVIDKVKLKMFLASQIVCYKADIKYFQTYFAKAFTKTDRVYLLTGNKNYRSIS